MNRALYFVASMILLGLGGVWALSLRFAGPPAQAMPTPCPTAVDADLPAAVAALPNMGEETPSPNDREAPPGDRVDATPPTSLQRARAWLAATPFPSGDKCIDHLVQVVRWDLDPPPWMTSSWQSVGDLPAATQAAADRENNPLRVKPSVEDLAQLDAMIQEARVRMQHTARDLHIELQLALADAVRRGDYKDCPNSRPWPEGLQEELHSYARARAGQDFNTCVAPGHDLTKNRFIVLDREVAPRWFELRDQQRLAEAELKIAIRSFFLRRR